MPAPMLQHLHRRHKALKSTLAAHERAHAAVRLAACPPVPCISFPPLVGPGSRERAAYACPTPAAIALPSSPLVILARRPCRRSCVTPAPLDLHVLWRKHTIG